MNKQEFAIAFCPLLIIVTLILSFFSFPLAVFFFIIGYAFGIAYQIRLGDSERLGEDVS